MILNSGLSAFLKRMGVSSSIRSAILGESSTAEPPTEGSPTPPSSSTGLLGLSGLDVRMSRRNLLKLLATSAAVATTVDIERLLWVPKPIIVVPSMAGIERATFPFWQNRYLDHSLDALRYSMREVYNRCTVGCDPPGLIFTPDGWYGGDDEGEDD